ncbi:hypothetical protein R9C00_07600 [Flammeovirgaceae bacterium SG7u.111]|nr:hypothetical protein [Flammeovirgaceae bacterium SG7u.132]WPO37311.1 hypothetical protein R9C00_07600 [Flammeovirgaceae bacterium SG7u.111]
MPKKQQTLFQVKLGLFSLLGITLFGLVLFLIDLHLLPLVFLAIAINLSLVAPFFDIPALVEKGSLTYHSLFLLSERKKKGSVTIHGGTLFDYYFVLDKELSGQERTKLIMAEYLKGLLQLIQQEEKGVILKGTSYIINEKTAAKIGMKKVSTDPIQTFILAFNYFNLMASVSLARKAIKFPNISKVSTFQGTVEDIQKNENYIKKLILKLE